MPKSSRPDEPRLAWAYVREARATAEGVDLPDVGEGTTRLIRPGDGAPEPHRLTPVTAWAHLRPRHRPPAFCPVCLEPVTLKLGRRVRHHYAHAPGSACRAATGEGALHLAAKLRLAQELQAGGSALAVVRLCHRVPEERSSERCASSPIEHWPVEWDEVRVEQSLPSLRADLLLLRGGVPVLALEVCATHAVDEEKAAKYRSLGVPWLEVSAARVVPDGGVAWSPVMPLPLLGDSKLHPAQWRCPRHEQLFRAYQEYERSGVHRHAWRIVHLYRTDGGRSAGVRKTDVLLLWMMERREDGEAVEGWLERQDGDGPLSHPIRVRGREDAKRRLHREFLRWARWSSEVRGAVVDSPMPWTEGEPPPARERPRLFPQRLRVNPQRGAFEGPPGQPPLAWPAPLLETAEPHPVFGAAPVYWSDLPTGDGGPLLHAVVPPCWLTLRPHEWSWNGVRTARADFALSLHDRRRWNELRQAAFSHTLPLHADAPSPSWGELLRAVATLAAEHAPALAAGRESLAELARPVLTELCRPGAGG